MSCRQHDDEDLLRVLSGTPILCRCFPDRVRHLHWSDNSWYFISTIRTNSAPFISYILYVNRTKDEPRLSVSLMHEKFEFLVLDELKQYLEVRKRIIDA